MKKFRGVYTTGQVAKMCRVSIQTIIRSCNLGEIESFKVPGSKHRRITQEALDEYIKDFKVMIHGGLF